MKYEDSQRGIIQNRARKRQLIDYSGLRYGAITPSDLDGFMEIHNKLFIFYEFKYIDPEYRYRRLATITGGQGQAEMNIVNGLNANGKKAVLFICQHNFENPEDDIIAHECKVDKIFYDGKMHIPSEERNCKEWTDKFISIHLNESL